MRPIRFIWPAAFLAVSVALGSVTAPAAYAQTKPADTPNPSGLTPTLLRDALADPARSNDTLAGQIKTYFGADALTKGARPKTENRPGVFAVAWAIEAPGLKAGEEPSVVAEDSTFALRLRRVGATDVYAGVAYRPDGIAIRYAYDVRGEKRGAGQIEDYPKNPEEIAHPEILKGTLTQMPAFHSKIFDGTTRDWWVYVPAGYSPDKPPAVMVFQDGGGPKGWVPTVFDNMIAKGEMPPTVGIFINPGKFEGGRANRSFEYDTLSDAYARFLLEEILPDVEKTTKLSHDPEMRAIFGVSSGGICAFTVAWERPDEFRKVMTVVGSFTNLQGGPTGTAGGNTYPAIIRKWRGWDRKGTPKPIRMYQTDGANDLDNAAGSWPLANQEVSSALTYGGYDHVFVFGNGFHAERFGRYKTPDGLRFLWGKSSTAATTAKVNQP